ERWGYVPDASSACLLSDTEEVVLPRTCPARTGRARPHSGVMSPVLTAVFRGHEGFVVVGLVVVALAATVTYRAARTRTSRPGILALWVSAATSLVVLTTWTTGSIGDSAVCVVNKDILEPFRGSQGLLDRKSTRLNSSHVKISYA